MFAVFQSLPPLQAQEVEEGIFFNEWPEANIVVFLLIFFFSFFRGKVKFA